MSKFLDKLPYTMLIPVAILLGLSPFVPEPHLVEKLRLLATGQLNRPLDIFDLLMHASPLILLAIKFLHQLRRAP